MAKHKLYADYSKLQVVELTLPANLLDRLRDEARKADMPLDKFVSEKIVDAYVLADLHQPQ